MTSTLLFQAENNNIFFLIFKKVTVKRKATEHGGGKMGVRPHKEGDQRDGGPVGSGRQPSWVMAPWD